VNAQGAAPPGGTRGQRLINGNGTSIPGLTGLPLLDAALVLINLACATTVADINAIKDKALALAISASIYHNIDPEVQLMGLRASVLENKPKLAAEWLAQQQENSAAAPKGPPSIDEALRRVGIAAFLENLGGSEFLRLTGDEITKFAARNLIPERLVDIAVDELRRRRNEAKRLLPGVA
jgi:hypothetical protein